jgi:hypothetical protein
MSYHMNSTVPISIQTTVILILCFVKLHNKKFLEELNDIYSSSPAHVCVIRLAGTVRE